MSDNEFEGPEAPYTITLKGGAGFESPWLVVRATSAEDAVALLGEAVMAELPEKIAEFAGDFREKVAGAGSQSAPQTQSGGSGRRSTGSPSRSGGSRGGAQQRRASAPAPTQNSEVEYHPEGDQCDSCGEPVIYKEISSRGKKFELWVCPNQRSKGDGHYSEFIN